MQLFDGEHIPDGLVLRLQIALKLFAEPIREDKWVKLECHVWRTPGACGLTWDDIFYQHWHEHCNTSDRIIF